MVEIIVDLRRALEYLITRRDADASYSNRPETSSSTHQPQDVSGRLTRRDEEELTAIPKLVNRILMEHYYPSNSSNDPPRVENGKWTKHQKNTVTRLLLAVIVEFSEPYFIRMTLREEHQGRLLLLQRQQQRNNENKTTTTTTTTTSNNDASLQNCSSLDKDVKFDNRAVAWATSCIHQLLFRQPRQSSGGDFTKETGDNIMNGNNDCNSDYTIPELDALLAASGPHDGITMQERIHCALMNGLNGRRLLRRNIDY